MSTMRSRSKVFVAIVLCSLWQGKAVQASPSPNRSTQPDPNSTKVATAQLSEGYSFDISTLTPAKYPERERALGIGGKTVVSFTYDAQGDVITTTIKESSGNLNLDNAAEASVRIRKVRPGLHDGQPIGGSGEAPIMFVSDGPAQPHWVRIGGKNSFGTKGDLSSLIRTGDEVELWTLQNFDEPIPMGTVSYQSRLQRGVYDCVNNTSAVTSYALFAEKNGAGRFIFAHLSAPNEIALEKSRPDPGTDGVLKFACTHSADPK